jgi:lipopolysaccharide cholinephosphotransferase
VTGHAADGQPNRVQQSLLAALRAVDGACRSLGIDYWLDGGTLLGAVRHGAPIPWDDDIDLCMLRPAFERFAARASAELGPQYTFATPADDPYVAVSAKVFVNGTHIGDDYARRHGLPGTAHDGLFVDIVVLDPVSRVRLVRRAERVLSGLVGARPWAAVMARSPQLRSPGLGSRLRRLRWTVVARAPRCVVEGVEQYLLWRARVRRSDLLGPRAEGLHRGRTFRRADIFPLRAIEFGGLSVLAPRDPHAYLCAQYGPAYLTPPPVAQRRTHGSVRFDT